MDRQIETIRQGLEYIHSTLLDILNDNVDKDEVLSCVELIELMRETN